MFNRGDSAAAVSFIRSAMRADPQDHRTPEQRAGNMRTMRGRLGAMTPTSVVSQTATEIVFTVRAENEPSATITMNIEASAPYRITGMRSWWSRTFIARVRRAAHPLGAADARTASSLAAERRRESLASR